MARPQFSLRWLLAVLTGSAFICLIVSFGFRGHRWPLAIGIGLAALATVMVLQAGLYVLLSRLAKPGGLRPGSPLDEPVVAAPETTDSRESA